ncbi:MAG: hypothetical protein FJ387_11070 [Verrucomicrobia bacterium]|nr:hypothetical protein [Verrucomicrobiota bacterium]
MRTTALFLTAALSAGAATTLAQVYSVNAVGYINLQLPVGFSMVANQLDAGTGNNTVSKLLASVPDGTIVYKYTAGAFQINAFDLGEWSFPNATLEPGEGAFIRLPSAATVTLVGEVPQGNLTTALPAGFSIVSSKVPQTGQLDTVLGFPVADGDIVYRFNNATGAYSIHIFDLGEWDNPPSPAVGEAFWARKVAAATWTRQFSVNNP